jgi:AraC-like DNA-binding protein
MPDHSEVPIRFRTLHDGALVRIREYDCHACRSGSGGEETSEADTMVLMRRGAFCRHIGRVSATADVNQAAFFAKGSVYRVSHPVDCGDRGTVFAVTPRVLHEIVCELDPRMADRPGQPFPFLSGPCSSDLFWRHQGLIRRLAAKDQHPIEPFWTEETALQLVADALEAAFATRERPRRGRRLDTHVSHADLAEAVKQHLATTLGERLTLEELARVVHTSPYHLARIFQQHAGLPIHRYLTLLRLRASLEHLAGGQQDLTALALDLGFSSHSHFTDTFRREFGCAPSEVRNGSWFRKWSKNLEV